MAIRSLRTSKQELQNRFRSSESSIVMQNKTLESLRIMKSKARLIKIISARMKSIAHGGSRRRLEELRTKISHLEDICQINRNPYRGISPITSLTETETRELASKVSVYLQQGYELYKSSLEMDIVSSPLLSYYAFLQIVKAFLLLDLSFNEEGISVLYHHGLRRNHNIQQGDYIKAIPCSTGVFPALLILFSDYFKDEENNLEIFQINRFLRDNHFEILIQDEIYSENFLLSQNIIEIIHDIRNCNDPVPNLFMCLWMLSELVRYKPEEWKKLCEMEDDTLLGDILETQNRILPLVIEYILDKVITQS